MSQNLQNIAKFQKFQLENLVDFEKCCKTHILLQKSEPIQPKTSNILPKFCQPTLSDVSASELIRWAPRSARRTIRRSLGSLLSLKIVLSLVEIKCALVNTRVTLSSDTTCSLTRTFAEDIVLWKAVDILRLKTFGIPNDNVI